MIFITGLLISAILIAGTKSANLPATYENLAALNQKLLHHGLSPKDKEELVGIRDTFVRSGAAGINFMISRLQEMNAEEMNFLQGSQSQVRILDFGTKHPGHNLLKYDICFILAESYGASSPQDRAKILDVLQQSYTPATHFDEAQTQLDWALFLIGKDSVPLLLNFAVHPNRAVRCAAQDLLNIYSKGHSSAPVLNCQASSQRALRQARE